MAPNIRLWKRDVDPNDPVEEEEAADEESSTTALPLHHFKHHQNKVLLPSETTMNPLDVESGKFNNYSSIFFFFRIPFTCAFDGNLILLNLNARLNHYVNIN